MKTGGFPISQPIFRIASNVHNTNQSEAKQSKYLHAANFFSSFCHYLLSHIVLGLSSPWRTAESPSDSLDASTTFWTLTCLSGRGEHGGTRRLHQTISHFQGFR